MALHEASDITAPLFLPEPLLAGGVSFSASFESDMAADLGAGEPVERAEDRGALVRYLASTER